MLRLFDYIADNFGYRIVKESLFKVGAAAPGAVVATRGGDIELGFEVYPLDGAPQGVLPASRSVINIIPQKQNTTQHPILHYPDCI